MPRVSQPAARGAGHKSQKPDGGAVTPAGASWPAVGGREPPLSDAIHLPGSRLGLLLISRFITLPCSPGGCFYSHFPAPSIEITRPGSQRRVCGAGHSPCLQSSFQQESGPLGACSSHLSPCCHCSSCSSRRPWGLAPEHLDPPPKLAPQPEEQWGDRGGMGSGSHHTSTSFQDIGSSSPTATCLCPGCRTWINWWSSCRWRIRTLPSASGSAPAPTQTSPSPSCRPASR